MPLSRSILWILLMTLCISGSAFMGWLYYLHMRHLRLKDDTYRIAAIVQRTTQADALKSVYLAELLGLSLDRPSNLYQFNTSEAKEILLKNPLIKEASLRKILPGTLYIDYVIRTPIAFVGDFSNTAVDFEGVLFPFSPFYTPKRLPVIYLGLSKEEYQWGSKLDNNPLFQMSIDLLGHIDCIGEGNFEVKQLDVAQALAESYGRREIVLVVENVRKKEGVSSLTLRLSTDHFMQDLVNFRTLYTALEGKEKDNKGNPYIFDFRISNLAFIKNGN